MVLCIRDDMELFRVDFDTEILANIFETLKGVRVSKCPKIEAVFVIKERFI